MTHELTDAELLTRFRAGHDAALGRLFERYEGPVFRFLFGVLRDHHQAEDALQETFVQALRKADAIDPATFRGWLYTVAYQQGMLQKRRARRRPAAAEPGVLVGVAADAGPDAERADDLRAVTELLAELPAAQREVIRLRVYDGLRFREVAERVGCPLNTALARMHDGLKKLRALWEARHA
ncbi:MAG TPA: sigma-70 family RNA polymerase sigma factor [Fimbriiglobus sp.]|nr:sigma-70 family RNA polymerase sigma factor [Fimbriiglobus sp.]